MEYSRLPVDCMKPITEFIQDQETYFATQHGGVTVRKATATDIAKIEAELAAKANPVTIDILGELKLARKPEKPVIPFEEMAVKSRVAKTVKFERVVG